MTMPWSSLEKDPWNNPHKQGNLPGGQESGGKDCPPPADEQLELVLCCLKVVWCASTICSDSKLWLVINQSSRRLIKAAP